MVKGLILDIDGVIVGEKIGYNSPYPHPDVISRLKSVRASGIPVILSTGKPHYSIAKIIADCGLNNPHVVNNGAIIIDPMQGKIVKKHVMDKTLVAELLETYISAGFYTELYTSDAYYIQKNQYRKNLTPVHTHVLQTEPQIVPDLAAVAHEHEVIKVMPVAIDDATDKNRLLAFFEPFRLRAEISIGIHPVANPHRFGAITAKGVSKRQSTIDAVTAIGLRLADCLGVGDTDGDWLFIELCGYKAAIGNASDGLKQNVIRSGQNGYAAYRTVDENGVLEILDHFLQTT